MANRIALVAPDPEGWASRFHTIEQRLKALVPEAAIAHIGSTAVPDLPAKDVVDVLVGVDADAWTEAVAALVADGFVQDGSRDGHAWLAQMKGEERTVVIHVVVLGGAEWKRRISFRDILRRDPAARAEYLEVKRQAAGNAQNWTDYTARKAAVVARILA
nr:GrpB family protein [Arthrobacter pigmenti]